MTASASAFGDGVKIKAEFLNKPMSNAQESGKEPWLATILSKLLPGVGQIYAGKVTKGWILIVVTLLGYFFGLLQLLFTIGNPLIGIGLLLVGFMIWIWNLFDAHRCSREANDLSFEENRKRTKDPWLAVFLSAIIPGIGHIYLGQWFFAIAWIALAIVVAALSVPLYIVFAALIAYHTYISAPVRRERSRTLILIVCFLLLLLSSNGDLIKSYAAESRYIPSESMLPTLQINDRLIVNKLLYRFSSPQRKEIIVFYPPDEAIICSPNQLLPIKNAYIQRIVGLPGETVEIKNKQIYINGKALAESYIKETSNYILPSLTIPSDSYFVLGDNRNHTCDSHIWGFVPRKNIIGKATNIFFPLGRAGAIQ